MKVDLTVESKLEKTARVSQVSASFDCPLGDNSSVSWSFDFPFDDVPWDVGLIVGPSGSGKSSILRHVFGNEACLKWGASSVVDDFLSDLSIADIVGACSSVGFNSIPSWIRPFAVLSNGEKFRAELARRLLLEPKASRVPIVVDEFTSVVDRQVAKIGAHAVQKFVRKTQRRFVAATCHYDVLDWLQPDWVLDMATQQFTRRLLQRRPPVVVEIKRVERRVWERFSRYHYLTSELHKAARCFAAFVDDEPVAFAGVLHRPHPKVRDIKGVSRLVTLPDWQGLGLAFALTDTLGAAYKACGYRLHTYPAHPSLMRSFDVSQKWKLARRPAPAGRNGIRRETNINHTYVPGTRPCPVCCYTGETIPDNKGRAL